MVRLKDIAQRAGVSIMTVSKALRDGPDVSPATKARIKLLAQQLGYVPDSSAQGLRTRTTRLFGLAIPSAADPFFARVVLAIEEQVHEMGYDILLAHTLNIPEREEGCIKRFLSRRVEGIFLFPVYRLAGEAHIYQELQARATPTVLLGHGTSFCSQFVSISTDDLLGGYAAAQHLVRLGHKRIAILSGPPAAPWAQARFEGYRRALREANLDIDDKLVFQAGRSLEEGAKAATQMLNESCAATAILAINDPVAVGCAEVLRGQGLQIPQDVSLVGFGNIPIAEHFCVPLTTLRQAKYRLGVAAVEAMRNVLRRQRADSKQITPELIVRASSGPPPPAPRLLQAKSQA